MLALFALLTSGGCGSSTSSLVNGTPYIPSDANSVLTGAWRYTSGTVTATLGGTAHNLTVLDFAAYFGNCSVEDEDGTAAFAAVAPLKGETLTIPMAFDTTSVTTKREDVNEWTVNSEHGTFTVTLLSDTTARLSGTIALSPTATAELDMNLAKVTNPSAQLDIDTVLNGTWQTSMNINDDGTGEITGGGIMLISSGDIIPFTSVFANMIFENTSINDGSTILTANAMATTFDENGSSENPSMPTITEDYPVEITNMFGNVYRLKFAETDKGVFMLNDDHTAYLIISSSSQFSGDVTAEAHILFPLTKKTSTDTVIITDQVGTTWEAATGAGFFMRGSTVNSVALEKFTVSFPEADVENKKVTISAHGTFSTATGVEVPIDYDALELEVERVGYNTYFAETEHGSTFMVTLIDDDTAMLTVKMIYDANTTAWVIGLMVKTYTDINAVWKGAWRYSAGEASVLQNGGQFNISIQDFAAYFDSVDVAGTNGTAIFSAVAALSSDAFLIPMVYDEVPMTTTKVSGDEWTAKTELGDFTIKLLTPSSAKLSGTVDYSGTGITLVINWDVTLSKVASSTLPPVNIDSVLDGTWFTKMDVEAQTGSGGGFMVINNMLYPSNNAFANIIFKDTSIADKTSTVTASGVMWTHTLTGAQGPAMPITIANRNVEVTHIFSNFYRLALDENMKGVFVVQGENSAYFILEVIDDVSGAHVHSLFMLEKKTGSDTVTISSLQNTSWDIGGSGAMYNTALGTQSVTMEDGILSIYEASDTFVNQKINGVMNAGTYTMPLEDRPVTFTLQDIGYNSWLGSAEYNPAVIYTMLNNNSGVLSIVTTVDNNTTLSFIGMIRRR